MLPTQKRKEACKILGGLNLEEKRTVNKRHVNLGMDGGAWSTCIGFCISSPIELEKLCVVTSPCFRRKPS